MTKKDILKFTIYSRADEDKDTAKGYSLINLPRDGRIFAPDGETVMGGTLDEEFSLEQFISLLFKRRLFITKNFYIVNTSGEVIGYFDAYGDDEETAYVIAVSNELLP